LPPRRAGGNAGSIVVHQRNLEFPEDFTATSRALSPPGYDLHNARRQGNDQQTRHGPRRCVLVADTACGDGRGSHLPRRCNGRIDCLDLCLMDPQSPASGSLDRRHPGRRKRILPLPASAIALFLVAPDERASNHPLCENPSRDLVGRQLPPASQSSAQLWHPGGIPLWQNP